MVTALVATVLDRPLTQLEDAAVFAAVEHLGRSSSQTPTLTDLAAHPREPARRLSSPGSGGPPTRRAAELSALCLRARQAPLPVAAGHVRRPIDGARRLERPGIVLDLSAVPIDSEALPLVMVAAAGWLSQLMAGPGTATRPGPRRGLGAARQPPHRLATCRAASSSAAPTASPTSASPTDPSDLGAQADDGTATAKIAAGLLADSATKILLRQAPDQLEAAATQLRPDRAGTPDRRSAHPRPSALEGRRPNRRRPPHARPRRGRARATPTVGWPAPPEHGSRRRERATTETGSWPARRSRRPRRRAPRRRTTAGSLTDVAVPEPDPRPDGPDTTGDDLHGPLGGASAGTATGAAPAGPPSTSSCPRSTLTCEKRSTALAARVGMTDVGQHAPQSVERRCAHRQMPDHVADPQGLADFVDECASRLWSPEGDRVLRWLTEARGVPTGRAPPQPDRRGPGCPASSADRDAC